MKLGVPETMDSEWEVPALNGEVRTVNGRKERIKFPLELWRSRRGRRAWYQSGRANRNRLDLPEISTDVQLLSIEAEVDTAGVTGPDHDRFPTMNGTLFPSLQKFRATGSAIDSHRDPALLARLNHNTKLAGRRRCGPSTGGVLLVGVGGYLIAGRVGRWGCRVYRRADR